jgi:hypothetical protein
MISGLSRSADFWNESSLIGSTIEILVLQHTYMLKKTGEFFSSGLKPIVKRGFVEPCKNVPL